MGISLSDYFFRFIFYVWKDGKIARWKPLICLTYLGFRVINRLPKNERSTYIYDNIRKNQTSGILLQDESS